MSNEITSFYSITRVNAFQWHYRAAATATSKKKKRGRRTMKEFLRKTFLMRTNKIHAGIIIHSKKLKLYKHNIIFNFCCTCCVCSSHRPVVFRDTSEALQVTKRTYTKYRLLSSSPLQHVSPKQNPALLRLSVQIDQHRIKVLEVNQITLILIYQR